MINQSNKVLNTNLTKLVNKTYQYGFSTNIEKDIIKKGLNEQTVRLISDKKKEPSLNGPPDSFNESAAQACNILGVGTKVPDKKIFYMTI